MEPLLVVDRLNKAFGGLKVTFDISFTVMPGDLSAIIGPNGAGKTTLFNQITRHLTPDSGRVLFQGEDITAMKPQTVVSRGMGRAFQITSIFPEETVLENVRIACLSKRNEIFRPFRHVSSFREATDRAYAILESLGLESHSERYAFELAHGDQKLLDIGIALGLEPTLLLLDEPTSGMSPEERQLTRELIVKLWKELNLTLIFIEHDMDIVFGIAQMVQVLHLGRLLAEGTPEEIRNNPEVITAYLGEDVT